MCIRDRVIRGGAYRGGKRIARPVSLMDPVPTIVAIAGLDPQPEMDGRALGEPVRNPDCERDPDILIQISESQVARALRTPRYQYYVSAPHLDEWQDERSDVYVEECLYDLETDPYELLNLVGLPAYHALKEKLREKLVGRIVRSGEPLPRIVPLT